jgi:Concanavalin A-like lectin/glucanases superfamily
MFNINKLLMGLVIVFSAFAELCLAQSNFPDVSLSPKTVIVQGGAYVDYSSTSANSISGIFDGDGDYLVIDPDPVKTSTRYAIESWIYIESMPDSGFPIVSKSDQSNSSRDQQFYVSKTGANHYLRFKRYATSIAAVDLVGTINIPLQTWTHVALTYDQTYVRLFVNGVLDVSFQSASGWNENTYPFYVAMSMTGSIPSYANGQMSELRITKNYPRYERNFVPMPLRPIQKPTPVDPSFSKVSLLLNADGPDGSTQASDISSNPKLVTFNGNAKISTERSVFGGSSLLFDGNGDYVTVPNSNDFQLSGDFTIESWVYLNSVAGVQCIASTRRNNNITHTPVGLFIEDGRLRLVSSNATNTAYGVNLYGTSTMMTGMWYHVMGIRSGNSWSVFVNGIQEASVTSSNVPYVGNGTTNIGGDSNTNYLNGYIDDIRITKGLARYTSNFSVPQKTYPTTTNKADEYFENVSLLLNGNGDSGSTNIVDVSVLPKQITATGDAQISNTQPKFGTGALAFDGNGDYVISPSSSDYDFGKELFTIEGWFYLNAHGASGEYPFIISRGDGAGALTQWAIAFNPLGNGINLNIMQPNGSWTNAGPNYSGNIALNTWYHFALVRNDSSSSGIKLFLNGILVASSVSNPSMETNPIAKPLVVGSQFSYKGINGYLDDLRITKGIARYTENFIPPQTELKSESIYRDPFLKDVIFQLDGEGKDNSQYVTDTSLMTQNITVAGNTKVSTTQKVGGLSSLYFDGSGDSLSLSANNDFDFSSVDFTIESWFYPTAYSGSSLYGTIVSKRQSGADFDYVAFLAGDSKILCFSYGTTSVQRINLCSPVNSVSLNQWHHFSVVRHNNKLNLFLNGVLVNSQTLTESLRHRSLPFELGKSMTYSDSYFSGYIDDLRITRGVARYSNNFTPEGLPQLPVEIGDPHSRNTVILLNGNNGEEGSTKLIDATLPPNTMTATDNAKITKVVSKYGGSSMYFDGNGDYFSAALPPPGQEDFTIEGWLKPTVGALGGLAGFSAVSNYDQRCLAQLISVTSNSVQIRLTIQAGTGTGKFITGTAPWDGSSWIHFVVQRTDGTGSVYVNGQLVASGDATNNITGTAFKLGHIYTVSANTFYAGALDDIRYTNGIARYTENFTPPAQELQAAQYLYDPYGSDVELSLLTEGDDAVTASPYIVQASIGALSNVALTSFDISFSQGIDLSSFTTSDILIANQNAQTFSVSNIQPLNSKQFRITLSSPLSDGQYSLKVGPDIRGQNNLLLDQNNNKIGGELTDVYTKNFTIDLTKPIATVLNTYPATVNAASYTFSGTKEANSKVLLNGTVIVSANSATTWSYALPLTVGSNTFSFVLEDAAGNQSLVTQANITYENSVPGPVIFNINAQGNGQELSLSWFPYDEVANENDIKRYNIYLSTSNFTNTSGLTPVQTIPKGTKTAKLTNLVRNQTYYIAVVAEDNSGQALQTVISVAVTPIETIKVWNATADFSSVSNPNGVWSYGYSPGLFAISGYQLKLFNSHQSQPVPIWQDSAYSTSSTPSLYFNNSASTHFGVPPGYVALHPGPVANGDLSILRFTAPSSGVYQVNAKFYVGDFGETEAWIIKNGSFQVPISSLGATSSNPIYTSNGLQLQQGDMLDFVVGNRGEFSGDSTPLTVQISSDITKAPDDELPVINSVSYLANNVTQDLRSSSTLTQSGKIVINATDKSSISRVLIDLDGQPFANLAVTNGQGAYEKSLALESITDGSHQLAISVYDEHENLTQETLAFTVDLNAPALPTFTAPAANSTTNQTQINLTGKSTVGTLVSVSNNGSLVKQDVSVDASGNFATPIELTEGDNLLTLKARYSNRTKFSAETASRKISLNTQIPDAPTGLSANALAQGQVSLSWNAVVSANSNNQVNGYNLYRSTTAFSSISDVGVIKVNSSLIKTTNFTDLLITDGVYYFAVSSVNTAGNQGNLSATVNTTSDRLAPSLTSVIYSAQGEFDSTNQRFGKGSVQVSATFSEPLRNQPYFAVVPQNGLPMSVTLTKDFANDTLYTGQFTVNESTGSGLAYAVVSAHDKLGNRGTEIEEGDSILIDTQGPDVTSLSITPAEPLKVDELQGLDVNVEILLNDQPVNGSLQLIPLLDGATIPGIETGVLLTQTGTEQRYAGMFHLPTSAGQNAMANLSFIHVARDDLNNISQRINGKNQFQVYQGNLPPLAVPQNLLAQALPGGKIKLTWQSVDEAVGYVVYRQGPNDSAMQALPRVTATEWEDQTSVDGTYLYAVASVRNENTQEAESAKSNSVSVIADRVAPAAPQNLTLELNGAGIVSRWIAPMVDAQGNTQNLQGLTYHLYRVNLPANQQVTDVTGLTPIQTKIPALIALDTKPAVNEHSYFVTAVDAAGNQSTPSNTSYLNFGLLPVSQLFIQMSPNGFPEITWQHKGTAIKEYRVYRKTGSNSPLLLTPAAIPHTALTTQYLDITYNNSQPTEGATTEVTYSVVAVDENNVESIPHELLLPALSTRLENNPAQLQRGVMNELRFAVDNKGNSVASRVKLFVTLTENGSQRVHQSDYFTVPASASSLVPVVIGGYEKLDAITVLSVRIEQQPQDNQQIRILQHYSAEVGQSSLTANLITQDFTRGGTGKVAFSITNTSQVETELVMATNSGKADSNEIRLVLEDLQGNLLAKKSIRQTLAGVISVASGQTVARIAPNETFTSGEFTLNVPSASPDQIRLRLEIDKFHYHLGQATHVAINGTDATQSVALVDTPYFAEVTSVEPAIVNAKEGEVVVTGRVLDRNTQQALANVPVSLIFTLRGFERKFTVYTDDLGQYTYSFKPDGAAGKYTLAALHPSVTDRPNMGSFIAEGGSISPTDFEINIPRNYTHKLVVKVSAGYDTQLSNVRLVLLANGADPVAQLPTGISASSLPIGSISPTSSSNLTIQFTGDNTATASGLVSYRVEADGHTGADALGTVNIRYTLSTASPAIITSPTFVDTGVGLDQQIVENISVSNKGLETLLNAQVQLLGKNPAQLPAWISLATDSNLGDIPVGESRNVQLIAAPDSSVAEGIYELVLQIKGDNSSAYKIPVFVKVTQSGQGSAFFKVSDIYTATLDGNQQLIEGVSGAKIKLQNENVLSEVFNLTSDAKGEAIINNIPAGRYAYRITAYDHSAVSGRVWIKPGVTLSENVFLMNELVKVEWSVREITIEDRYEIKLAATFKTNVPAPVVMIDPLHVQLPVMKKGDVFQGELVITNHGLIRAYDVLPVLPKTNDLVKFEFLKTLPNALESKEVFVMPYRVQALRDFNPVSDAGATGGGCGEFNTVYVVPYKGKCANDQIVDGHTQTSFNVNWGSCLGGSGSTTNAVKAVSVILGPTGSSGGSGWGSGPMGGSISGEPQSCAVEAECDACDSDNASAE